MRTSALIGVAGRIGSGKTTVARYLAEKYDCVPYALADNVRAALYELDPIVALDGRTVRDVIDSPEDWQAIKADPVVGPEVRQLLQRLGTDIGRKMFGTSVWLFASEVFLDTNHPDWWSENKGPQIVVHDIRFNNEAQWVKLNKGTVINVTRPSLVPPQRDHESEKGIDPKLADYSILNVGSLNELFGQVDHIYQEEFGRVRSVS
jgi:hypothetical protein